MLSLSLMIYFYDITIQTTVMASIELIALRCGSNIQIRLAATTFNHTNLDKKKPAAIRVDEWTLQGC